MLVRIYGVPCMHEFCAVDVFWNITRRQAISPVNKSHYVLEFNDSAGDIDLYQMSLSQSESTILHESIIQYPTYVKFNQDVKP